MSEAELRLEIVRLVSNNLQGYGLTDILKEAEKVYAFVKGKSACVQ